VGDWQTHGSKLVHQNNWYTVRQDDVTNPAGTRTTYSVVELTNDVVYIAAVDANGMFCLVKQFRYPIGRESWEFVAGQSDGQSAEAAAARELHEETALSANKLEVIAHIQTDTGFCNTPISLVLAQGLSDTGDNLDPTDGILDVRRFSQNEIRDMIMSGEIVCPHTIASFYIATNYLEKEAARG
jgi:8-oxo-dGTP pyrophosphatase MutT (NUDIX family)